MIPSAPTRSARILALVATGALALSSCAVTESNDRSADAGNGKITVTSTDSECTVSADTTPAGNVVFDVTNDGSKVTEFYLYGEDGLRIAGEVENIGPGLSRQLVMNAPAGKYFTACKPGMVGKGIRAAFTVTKSDSSAAIKGVDQAAIDQATSQYAAYVKDQSQQLVQATSEFTKAYVAGDSDAARQQFPHARGYWERIETVAESFGDLDPKMDLREADLEPGQKWTGWHRIEKDLWPPATGYQPLSQAQRRTVAEDLLANTKVLDQRVQDLDYTVDQIGNGSKGLLDEVASGKITGEEDIWSHTDLYDFQANVDGARVGFEGIKPILDVKDPALAKDVATRFADLQKVLDKYKTGKADFVSYDKVTKAQRKQLSDAVNALSEPLSKVTGAITL